MLLLRDVSPRDEKAVMRLARALDTMNLPADESALKTLIRTSVASFSGRIADPLKREYLFVLEDARGALVGTSLVIAQHGTREAPHVYYDTYVKEHYSESLDRLFRHQVLALRYDHDGPTEIGGLVVMPNRRGAGKPGKQLSFVRFLWMAMHPERFREKVLAELLPPLLPDGRSPMWEYLGGRFTGLPYQDADRLSRENKEFIRALFPHGEIYTSLLPKRVQAAIGKVGPETRGVQRMLESIGFRYANAIDPFDGGPHFIAPLEEITLVKALKTGEVARAGLEDAAEDAEERLVGHERSRGDNRFRAVWCRVAFRGGRAYLPGDARERLGIRTGARVHTIPFA
jgi:arginine N-succinyltransferase